MLTRLAAPLLAFASHAAPAPPEVGFAGATSSAPEAAGAVALEVRLSALHTLDVQVPYTLGGTAKPGSDYSVPPGPLVIPAGQLSADLVVSLLDEALFEADETLVVDLGTPINATLGALASHTLSIVNDDGPVTNTGRQQPVRPLDLVPAALSLPATRAGELSSPVPLSLENHTGKTITLEKLALAGLHPSEFDVLPPSALPLVIPDGQAISLDVVFQPSSPGPRAAELSAGQTPHSHVRPRADLSGTAFGPLGAEVLTNCGGPAHQASAGASWTADYGFTTPGHVVASPGTPIQGTSEPALYEDARAASVLHWEYDLPDGSYLVRLHFAELQFGAAGLRVFDVDVEGQAVRKNLDVFTQVGKNAALQVGSLVTVTDGRLEVDLLASVGEALLSALEVRSLGELSAAPGSIDFGVLDVGQVDSVDVTLQNVGLNALHANSLAIQVHSGDGSDFTIELAGVFYAGNSFNVSHAIDLTLQPGETALARFYFSPSAHGFHDLRVLFRGDFPTLEMVVKGAAGVGGDPYLHPVLAIPPQVVDYDLGGSEGVLLDGSGSHTHEPGHALTAWEWRESSSSIASGEKVTVAFAQGPHTVELTIYDDNVPAHLLADDADFEVFGVDKVPGVLALYYLPGAGETPADLLDAVPANAEFAEVLTSLQVLGDNGIGGSGFTDNVMVRAQAKLQVPGAGTYTFVVAGGYEQRLEIDGLPVSGPVGLVAGPHDIEARWAVASTQELPLEVLADLAGGAPSAIDPSALTHDQRDTPPVINDVPSEGINLGGNQIFIDGFGFFTATQVVVHWGNLDLTLSDFDSWSAERIEFLSPPGSGIIDVTVETPQGVSNLRQFEYKANGPVPIVFDPGPVTGATAPTAAAWGPDGRLYLTKIDGTLEAITYAADYSVLSSVVYPGVSLLGEHDALGLAFDPFDPPGTVRVYVAHAETYAQGGGAFSGPSPYSGRISRLDGPGFDTPVPVVTNLPTSNHDHAINGMVFDDNGDLLVCVGGNTNAGVEHPAMGDLPESPLSGAILKVALSRPDFDGDLSYVETATGLVNMDQVFGEVVDLAPGTHVSLHATGLRNAFDLELTTWGDLYATDNGPNTTYGQASTGPNTQTPWHPVDLDELLHLEYGHYYGHPNRNRGRATYIENVYYGTAAAAVPGFTQGIATLLSSSNGIVEYSASTFNDQMRGNLITQRFNAGITRIVLTPDKQSVQALSALTPWTTSLNLITGPGGVLLGIDYQHSRVATFLPQDLGAVGLTVYDVFPWRAPAHGGVSFVIGGANFGTPADTTVTIGGLPATLTSVGPTRIRGIVPDYGGPSAGLVDVVVKVGSISKPLAGAFRYLPATPGLAQGKWSSAATLPVPLGEVASAAIDGKLYVVGETSGKTLVHDLASGTWNDTLAIRPFVGHHHAAEASGGKWYLIGGLGSGMGKVQIYDPAADSWSLGTDMPWPAGSVATCRIGDKIYASGGIVGSTTVDNCAVYDIPSDTWTSRASMPSGKGRNHAASGTDGQRFWVFGGRGVGSGAGNFVANGFADVQVYDPATNSWQASFDPGSTLPPLPIGRGGTGKAVFHKGEFYVMGGETLNGPGAVAGNVYERVDVYDPLANTWRLESPLPTARHGICPVVWQGKVYVAGGGVQAGFSNSNVLEVFYKP